MIKKGTFEVLNQFSIWKSRKSFADIYNKEMKAVLHKRDSKIFNRNGSIIIDNKNKVKLNEIEWNKHIISEMKRFESKIIK